MQPRCHSDCTRAKRTTLLDALVEDERLSVRFDALQRAPGPSKLGIFTTSPFSFMRPNDPRSPAYALRIVRRHPWPSSGRMPGYGVLRHGQDSQATKITLHPDDRRLWRWLQELRDIQGGMPPPLILNRHCQICEFRQRCRKKRWQRTTSAWSVGWARKRLPSTTGEVSSRLPNCPVHSALASDGRHRHTKCRLIRLR